MGGKVTDIATEDRREGEVHEKFQHDKTPTINSHWQKVSLLVSNIAEKFHGIAAFRDAQVMAKKRQPKT